jgi:hypothetical protein
MRDSPPASNLGTADGVAEARAAPEIYASPASAGFSQSAPRKFDEIVEGLRCADIDTHLQILIQLLGGTAFDLDRHVSLAGDIP